MCLQQNYERLIQGDLLSRAAFVGKKWAVIVAAGAAGVATTVLTIWTNFGAPVMGVMAAAAVYDESDVDTPD